MSYTVKLKHVLYDYKIETKLDAPIKLAALLQFLTKNTDYTLEEVLYTDPIKQDLSSLMIDDYEVIKILNFRREDAICEKK